MVQMIRKVLVLAAFASAGVAFAAEEVHGPNDGHDHSAHATQLPPGHPTTGPATAIGKLHIKATQGTKDGASLAGHKALVHFYQMDKVVKHAEVVLDANGTAVVENVELTAHPVQALVMLQYGKLTYQGVSEVMHSGATESTAKVDVYETTSETPDWRIPMRHLVINYTPQGVRVVEIVVAENRSDKTWIGKPDLYEGATLVLRLPEGAGNIETGEGFEPKSMHFHDGTMLNIVPMTPGMSKYNFAYTIPVKNGKVEIPVRSPTVTQQLMVFLPQEGTVKAVGLNEGEAHAMGEGAKMRRFSTAALPAGETVKIVLSDLVDSVTPTGQQATWSTPQIVGAIGLAVVLIGGAAFVMLKPTGGKPQAG